jgi:hypothetical protein
VAIDKIGKVDGIGMLAAGEGHDKIDPEDFGGEEQENAGDEQ